MPWGNRSEVREVPYTTVYKNTTPSLHAPTGNAVSSLLGLRGDMAITSSCPSARSALATTMSRGLSYLPLPLHRSHF